MWQNVMFVLGGIFIIIGIINLIWWLKRDRWLNCHGEIKSVKSSKDSEGVLWHYPRVHGIYNNENFEFDGMPVSEEPQIGTRVAVRYDPITKKYFDADNISIIASIICPILGAITLFVVALSFQNNQ